MYGGVAFFSLLIFFLCILLKNNILLTLPTYIMGLRHGQYRLKIGIVWKESVYDGEVDVRSRAVPDHEFTGFRIPDINRIVNSKSGRIRIPDSNAKSESDCVKNQNFLIHCSLVITRNLRSKGLHVIEMEGFC